MFSIRLKRALVVLYQILDLKKSVAEPTLDPGAPGAPGLPDSPVAP